MILVSASLASLTGLAESTTTWVKESVDNSVIKTCTLRLGDKRTWVAIPQERTYLVLGNHVSVSLPVSVVVPGVVSDKGSDKGPFGLHVETFGKKDKGNALTADVVFCYPIKKVIATKGKMIEAIYPGPYTYAPISEIKKNVERATSSMGDPTTHAVTEEMREFGKKPTLAR